MGDWFKRRLEGILDNLIVAGILAGIVAVWALLKTLPGPTIFVLVIVTFAVVLGILRLILYLVDRLAKKKHEYISDNYIRGRLIYLMDLLAPGSKPIIINRTIEDCEIRGPAMIALLGGVTIANSGFDGDIKSLFVEVPDKRMIFGAIGLQDCVFRRCRFTQIGIIGTREQIDKAQQGFTPPASRKEGS